MARTSMSTLITRLRGMTNAGTADFTVGSETYFSDDHLQDVLDTYRTDLNRVPLVVDVEYDGGTPIYKDYYAPVGNLEEYDASDASVFQVEDSDGNAAGTANYTVDYLRGLIRFSSDQAGTAYYLRGRSYDLNRAAADVWRRKGGFYAEQFDVATDNHRLSRSQKIKQCLQMAEYYEREAGPLSIEMIRDDLA